MDSSKKILIIQSYNANKGDNSVIDAMLYSLQKYHYDISLTAFDPQKAQKEYNIEAFEYLLSFSKMKMSKNIIQFVWASIFETVWFLYSLLVLIFLKKGFRLSLPNRKKGIINAYKNSDVVVLPGGHFFTSFNSLINNFSHYYGLRFAQLLGKKTMVYAQTIGPYHNNWIGRLEKLMANNVLRKANIVTLRESDSLKNYLYSNSVVTSETVFLKPVEKLNLKIENYIYGKEYDFVVGVTIHHIYYKHYFIKSKYIELMVGIFKEILKKYNCHILLIPMEDKYKTGGDRTIIDEMIRKVGKSSSISMISDDLCPLETANIISLTDIFIGTKTHSIVYSLKTFTPTLCISYQEKSTEFMKMFNMEMYSIEMKSLNTDDVLIMFGNIYENKRKIKIQMQNIYPQVIHEAEKNNLLLYKLVNDK